MSPLPSSPHASPLPTPFLDVTDLSMLRRVGNLLIPSTLQPSADRHLTHAQLGLGKTDRDVYCSVPMRVMVDTKSKVKEVRVGTDGTVVGCSLRERAFSLLPVCFRPDMCFLYHLRNRPAP